MKSLFICLLLSLFIIPVTNAEPIKVSTSILITWEAVTTNANGSPCDDLDGYAIYRSRESGNWTELTGKVKAFVLIPANKTECRILCPENGIWYWTVRAYDTSRNFADPSDEVETLVDGVYPSRVITITITSPMDVNITVD